MCTEIKCTIQLRVSVNCNDFFHSSSIFFIAKDRNHEFTIQHFIYTECIHAKSYETHMLTFPFDDELFHFILLSSVFFSLLLLPLLLIWTKYFHEIDKWIVHSYTHTHALLRPHTHTHMHTLSQTHEGSAKNVMKGIEQSDKEKATTATTSALAPAVQQKT